MREEFLLRPGPELADVFISLDRLVPELEPVFRALGIAAPDIEVAHNIAQMVEFKLSARRIREAYGPKRRDHFFSVADVAAGYPQGGIGHLAIDIKTGSLEAGNDIKILPHPVDEALVALG